MSDAAALSICSEKNFVFGMVVITLFAGRCTARGKVKTSSHLNVIDGTLQITITLKFRASKIHLAIIHFAIVDGIQPDYC